MNSFTSVLISWSPRLITMKTLCSCWDGICLLLFLDFSLNTIIMYCLKLLPAISINHLSGSSLLMFFSFNSTEISVTFYHNLNYLHFLRCQLINSIFIKPTVTLHLLFRDEFFPRCLMQSPFWLVLAICSNLHQVPFLCQYLKQKSQ